MVGRTVPSTILTAIGSDAYELATLVLLTKPDGTQIGFTDWNDALAVDLLGAGVVTYSPTSFNELSAFSAQINAPIDDRDFKINIGAGDITADQIRRGALDNSIIEIGYVIPTNLANPWFYCRYDFGQSDIKGLAGRLELMGTEKRLEQPVGYPLTANCMKNYGDKDCGIPTRADAWVAATAYPADGLVKRLTGSGIYWFKATVAGTSGASEPTWPTTLGGTVVDGTVTWTAIRARRLIGTVTSSPNRTTIVATGISIVNDYFGEGFITFQTGLNAGDIRRVKSDNGTGTLVIHQAAYDDIAIGDTFEALVGCRHRRVEDCITKHDNAANSRTKTLRYGGMDFLAGENITATAPKA
ncbi:MULTISPECIES: DUF2163 domain-containing protein [unclassified Mesorhizobium]|uniref:baseplate hub domain-containing protein n=1 Tax=unclassified Mesorhizobium TaxID=325217 RepID=UPI000FD95534|nr:MULTISPECIES: DUF2163 domain-containing protein [unclassified Mesorhizobium]TGT76706.1 DUF2163 domain-containing protein [Mesorhizobium sp. M2E.F.Ca.ET.166.01.1.1]TGW02818.1 DUF2163 domain-containing protein [Mesorhizobium sp. M2E.F.Ca.ET.154.01.1.1]